MTGTATALLIFFAILAIAAGMTGALWYEGKL